MSEEAIVDEAQLAKARRRLEAALELASRGATEEERAVAWSAANSIAQQYRIDLANISVRTHARRTPVSREIKMAYNSEFYTQLYDLVRDVFRHYGCRTKNMIARDHVVAVGFEEDMGMAEMVFTAAYLSFLQQLNVHWEGYRTFDSNVYLLKNSGLSWMDIVYAHNMHHSVWDAELLDRKSGSRLRAAYKRECERLGTKPPEKHSHNPARYRQSYANGFTRTLRQRLAASTLETNQAAEEAVSGSALALRAGEEIVEEAFYEMFPQMRPMTDEERRDMQKEAEDKAKAEAERRATLTDEQLRKEDQQADRERIRRDKEYDKWQHSIREDEQGWQAGYSAAHKVDLSGGSNGLSEQNRKALG